MNKRSAVLVAAGLVVALIAGGLALGYGIVGPSPTAAVASSVNQQQKPKIRTIKKNIKVHRKAKVGSSTASPNGTASVSTNAPSSSGSWSDDDSSDHETEGESEDD
jgi:hypothetical protein